MNKPSKKIAGEIISFEGPAYLASLLPRYGSRVVNIMGAVHAGPWHAAAHAEPLADVTAALLDEGTEGHSREVFRLALEAVGSQVHFWADGRYLYFSVLSTSRSLPHTLGLLFEALTQPLLSEASCREVMAREAAARVHAAEDTNIQAHRALSRVLFAEGSAGYNESPEEERRKILALTRERITEFHDSTYRGRVILTAIGDIEPQAFESLLTEKMRGWKSSPGSSHRASSALAAPSKPKTSSVAIPGKESTDVYMGSAVRITASDPSFPALRIAVDMFGGGFSDHLVQAIRDRDGLTYGALARIYSKENQDGLYFAMWSMFGNALLEKGVKAMEKELGVFLRKEITAKRFAEKLVELEGRYAVLYSRPSSAVRDMLSNMLSVGNAADSDAYVGRLRTLAVSDIKTAAEKHMRIDAIAAAGSVDAKEFLP